MENREKLFRYLRTLPLPQIGRTAASIHPLTIADSVFDMCAFKKHLVF